ncbi:hypothetical protein AAMO2058_001281000 [Amorphochlora amoebiformis]
MLFFRRIPRILARGRRGGAVAPIGHRSLRTSGDSQNSKKFPHELKGLDENHIPHVEGGHFPEFLEKWTRTRFYQFGAAGTAGVLASAFYTGPLTLTTGTLAAVVTGYWALGLRDIWQKNHTLKRNFPVLAHFRYLAEQIRPEVRQYFIESDLDGRPFGRNQRSLVYQRAKGMVDSTSFGTRKNVYEPGYEFANHSLFPVSVDEVESHVIIGGQSCEQPYKASLVNISAMSYGSLSQNAVIALNTAAMRGGFYHNTGEGGVTPFHRKGGDVVWNLGTGYFGCRTLDGKFDPDKFAQLALQDFIKMIEIKLSQGAKPSHGGILPADKLTEEIAHIRGVPMGKDVNSPPRHSAFRDPLELMHFIKNLRELSGGKPVGIKLCVGRRHELSALIIAMVETGITPDFITVDGAEGGTGAAPYEFTNSIGAPLREGLTAVHNLLRGAGIRNQIKLIASGKVTSGFDVVRNLALGADLCNVARGMMFALGCVQALKCNTNKCPTGITTQDPQLMEGLHIPTKAMRVENYQASTVHAALEIIGAVGVRSPELLKAHHILYRGEDGKVHTMEDMYPELPYGVSGGKREGTLLRKWLKGVMGRSLSSRTANITFRTMAVSETKMEFERTCQELERTCQA